MRLRFRSALAAMVLLVMCSGAWAQQAAVADTQSLSTLKKQAADGDAKAQYELGVDYARGISVPQSRLWASYWYRKAAEQGLAEAQDSLASAYVTGFGVPRDYAQAAYWYRKAAGQGFADAQDSLGHAYEEGQGVAQDYSQAVILYRQAAEQGDALAQWSLGSLYAYGKGVPQDYSESYFWLDLAASGKQNSKESQDAVSKLRDTVAAFLTSNELLESQRRARKWFEDHSVKAK